MARRKRTPRKPNFRPVGAIWKDTGFLPEELVAELRELLPRKLADAQKQVFLECCATEVQTAHAFLPVHSPAAQMSEELRAVESKANALLLEIQALSPSTTSTFLGFWDLIAFGTNLPVPLSDLSVSMRAHEGKFLGAAWDLIADLEAVSQYAAEQITPSRQARPSQLHARRLVQQIGGHFERIAGHPPPYSKETWFPLFMERVCAWPPLNLACGRALVESALKAKHPD